MSYDDVICDVDWRIVARSVLFRRLEREPAGHEQSICNSPCFGLARIADCVTRCIADGVGYGIAGAHAVAVAGSDSISISEPYRVGLTVGVADALRDTDRIAIAAADAHGLAVTVTDSLADVVAHCNAVTGAVADCITVTDADAEPNAVSDCHTDAGADGTRSPKRSSDRVADLRHRRVKREHTDGH